MSTLVHIAIVLDCTGSMQPWIEQAKTKIRSIISNSRSEHPEAEFRVALVGYRDYGDSVRFHILDFSNVDRVVEALGPIYAHGGNDKAEDVAGALRATTRLRWEDSDVRLVFHIADAPAHGYAFHDAHVSDRFPNGDPDGKEPLVYLSELADRNVEYTFVRITSATDKMLDVFHNVYGDKFRVIDLYPQSYDGRFGDVEDGDISMLLSPAVSRAVTDSIARYTSSQDT
jgi:hypothetical protein